MNNNTKKTKLIEQNYKWALQLSWENQANKLLNEYLLKDTLQYCGMFNWTYGLPTQKDKEIYEDFIRYFNNNNINPIPKILEVGTYTGTSLIKIVEMIPNSLGVGIDKWCNYNETKLLEHIEQNSVEKIFYQNITENNMNERIKGIKGDSAEILMELIKKRESFDFIYIDGSHKCLDTYNDCVLAWFILKKGGLMVIDDYLYNITLIETKPLEYPYHGINYFLEKYRKEIKIFNKGYRIFIEKI